MCSVQMVSTALDYLKAPSSKQLRPYNGAQNVHSKSKRARWGREASNCPSPDLGSNGSHDLCMTSPSTIKQTSILKFRANIIVPVLPRCVCITGLRTACTALPPSEISVLRIVLHLPMKENTWAVK